MKKLIEFREAKKLSVSFDILVRYDSQDAG